jgi:hypothetical protein
MATTSSTPDNTSSDYKAMSDYWRKITDLTGGVEALRAGGERYLERFESESTDAYNRRLRYAVFTDIFGDIVESLANKPFSKEVSLVDGSPRVKQICEDIDGQGNNLHNFASTFFEQAIEYAIDWVYVDYTQTSPNVLDANGVSRRKSVAEERNSGARPYWVRVPATEMIAVYSAVINGNEEFVHCRMMETITERAGWDEVTFTQVRELNREPILDQDGNIIALDNATYRVWRQEDVQVTGKKVQRQVWTVVDEGEISIGVIPIVPLIVGDRIGKSWQVKPSLRSCAGLQIDYYDEENSLKNIKKLTSFPMLSATGVEPEKAQDGTLVRAPVGPRAVLYGPPSESGPGKWEFIEPAATSLTFLRNELKEKAKELRELGRQPLTQSSGQLTTSTSDTAASKAEAAIQRWALGLKDSLENALYLTALWLGDAVEPTVYVDTDFELDEAKDDGFDNVQKMKDSGDLSQETLWEEAKRRRILSDEFTADRETKRLTDEMPDEGDQEDIDALDVGDVSPET